VQRARREPDEARLPLSSKGFLFRPCAKRNEDILSATTSQPRLERCGLVRITRKRHRADPQRWVQCS